MTVKKQLLGMVVLMLLVFSAQAFSQSNATITGLVADESGGVLPGASVTVTNNATGVSQKILTNSAGIYNVPGLPGGMYKVSAEMTGFQPQTKTDVSLTAAAQVRVNFVMKISQVTEVIEVSTQAENLLLEQSSSVGVILPEEKLTELPLVNSNVLDLIKVMGGVNMTDSPTFGADLTTFAGISAANVNLQRDGVTVNDVRWGTGLSSPVYLNPELIGEFKLVIAPVDAEMGRGSGQVQVITRSGANDFHGSAVWNIQNTALDANHWYQNVANTKTNWRNQQQYTLSLGGPIIKNKTFFFVSWDHQIVRIREHDINPQILTKCAQKGIFRWFYGFGSANYQGSATTGSARNAPVTLNVVDSQGRPQLYDRFESIKSGGTPVYPSGTVVTVPSYMPADGSILPGEPSTLQAASVFGPLLRPVSELGDDCENVTVDAFNGLADNSWVDYGSTGNTYDSLRIPDPTTAATQLDGQTVSTVRRFLSYTPQTPNNWDVGDGLNTAGLRWTRSNKGIDNVYGLGEGPNRKQLSFRIDHNFNASHRLSGGYSWETNNGEDAQPMWPTNSYGGVITRDPRNYNVSLTSTLRPTLLNEFRWGYSRTESLVKSPLYNDVNDGITKLRQIYTDIYDPSQIPGFNTEVPIIMGLGTTYQIYGGSNMYGSGRGNFGTYWGGHDPRMIIADTITWTKGRHSLKFGGEIQRTQSWQEQNGSISFGDSNMSFPYVRGGSSQNYGNRGIFSQETLPDYTTQYNYTLPGMTGTGSGHINNLYNLMNIHAGSIASVGQWYFINKADQLEYNKVEEGDDMQVTDFRQNQFNLFFKDDWKVTDNLTLNLGMRYEWYGVPYLKNGMTPGILGGAYNAFSVTGEGWQDFWTDTWEFNPTPGEPYTGSYNGDPSQNAFIGPDSRNPGQQVYDDDWNNFGPAVGFAYQLPWFGKGRTTLRGGYQVNFLTLGRANVYNGPGTVRDYTDRGAARTEGDDRYMNIASIPSLIPVPLPEYMKTPETTRLEDNAEFPLGQGQQGMILYDPNLATPYVHNLTLSLTRNIGSSLTVDVKYVGTLSRKTVSSINLNTPNYMTNGLKEMLDCARYEGYNDNSYCTYIRPGETMNQMEKLNAMLYNTSISPYSGPVGSAPWYAPTNVVTGAAMLRALDVDFGRYPWIWNDLANGNYNSVASSLGRKNILPEFNSHLTGQFDFQDNVYNAGTLLRYNGFPENWIFTSPQYSSVTMNMNMNHANYHSMQAQVTLRPTHGLSLSGTYTWSRNLGSLGFVDPRDRVDQYGLLQTHRSHAFTSYGTYDLPFGPNRQLFSDVNPSVLGRIIGGWQLSWIHTMQSGRPANISVTPGISSSGGRPDYVGSEPFDTKSGHVVWNPSDRYGNYFNYEYKMGKDPQCYMLPSSFQGFCGLYAVNELVDAGTPGAFLYDSNGGRDADQAVDDAGDWWGKALFQNPMPGTRGNFASGQFTTPMTWNTDMALTKAIRISEGKSFQLRIDATNVFNHPFPSSGVFTSSGSRTAAIGDFSGNFTIMNLSSVNDPGRLETKVGARTFQGKLRFDF